MFVISIVLFTLVGYQGENFFLRLGSRLLLLPFVAGISYEALKALAHSESRLARILRWPGMQMQRLTTRPPTNEMLEVAIVSMNVALYGLPQGCEAIHQQIEGRVAELCGSDSQHDADDNRGQ